MNGIKFICLLFNAGIPGDGRCLFRSVIHGAWLRSGGKQSPSENRQIELANELRAKIRQPHIWGGEPELLMCSHVLQAPITVNMREKNSGALKIISEYGKENPIRVLYHGYGH
ncbi:hypothetical protein CRYUN_Cryun04dG0160200 [Craigia yunnanensis]